MGEREREKSEGEEIEKKEKSAFFYYVDLFSHLSISNAV